VVINKPGGTPHDGMEVTQLRLALCVINSMAPFLLHGMDQ